MINNTSTEFYKYICKWLRKSSEEIDRNKQQITRKELEKRMGINWSSLHKVLNGTRRKAATRDYIIAVCSQLQMSVEETNVALYKYGFPVLYQSHSKEDDHQFYKRDQLLILLLNNSKQKRCTIDKINKMLIDSNLQVLDLPNRKEKKEESQYLIAFRNNKIVVSNAYFNAYDSLETLHSLDMYDCISNMYIEHRKSGERFKLQYSTDSNYCLYPIDDGLVNYMNLKTFKEPCESEEYESYFSLLKTNNEQVLNELYKKVDDTKNYKERVSASFENNRLNVFAEGYSYLIPEIDEYLFVVYSEGRFEYSLSKKSRFLRYSLKKDRYKDIFKNTEEEIQFRTNDLEQVKNLYLIYCKKYHDLGGDVVEEIQKQFICLKDEVEKLVWDLKDEKKFIRNSHYIYDMSYEYNICNYMGLLDYFSFECIDKEVELYQLMTDEFEYEGVIVTFDDVKYAFELGMNNIKEIYEAKIRYGNIKNIIDTL